MLHTAATLDAVDRSLLEALQKDGRATVGELAERVSLSTSPCWRRVRQLEESGVISGVVAKVDGAGAEAAGVLVCLAHGMSPE